MSKSCKTLLQEAAQQNGCTLPRYESFAEGESHAVKWRTIVYVWNGMVFKSESTHTTIKLAEADAAYVALRELKLLPKDLRQELLTVLELLEVSSFDVAKTRLEEIIQSLRSWIKS